MKQKTESGDNETRRVVNSLCTSVNNKSTSSSCVKCRWISASFHFLNVSLLSVHMKAQWWWQLMIYTAPQCTWSAFANVSAYREAVAEWLGRLPGRWFRQDKVSLWSMLKSHSGLIKADLAKPACIQHQYWPKRMKTWGLVYKTDYPL